MDKAQIFKIGTIVAAVLFAIFAILLFSGKIGGISSAENKNNKYINVWGTINEASFRGAMDAVGNQTGKPISATYTKIEGDLYTALVKAAQANASPDAVFADHEQLNSISDLITFIPYTEYSESEFTNNFILGSHQFATPYGSLFLPALVDPLVTIYNKSILTQAGITKPPKFWAELPKYQQVITKLGTDNSLTTSAFGLGTYNTVKNSRDILMANLLQLKHKPRTVFWSTDYDGKIKQTYNIDIGSASANNYDSDLLTILKFQTSFSDPQKTSFTWSEIGDDDYKKFISEKVAIYFGFASEIPTIKNKNQNLSVGFSYLPQMSDGNVITTGKIYGFAITNQKTDIPYTVSILRTLTDRTFTSLLASILNMSSARVDTLAGGDGGEYSVIVGHSALVNDVFFDTKPKTSQLLVKTLYANILNGTKTIVDAIDVFSRDWTDNYGQNINQ